MGNKLSCSCAPLIRKAYRYEDSPWQTSRRRDGHLLRLWAEVFHVSASGAGTVKWQQVSEDLVPVNITCIQDSPECVFHITAYNSQVDKILDVRLVQPGTRIGQASECFVYWKDPMTNDTWGLNFTSPIDAKQFRECCSPSFKFSRKASSSYSLRLEPPKQKVKAKRKPLSTPASPSRAREPQCTCMTAEQYARLRAQDPRYRSSTLPRAQSVRSTSGEEQRGSGGGDKVAAATSSTSLYDNVSGPKRGEPGYGSMRQRERGGGGVGGNMQPPQQEVLLTAGSKPQGGQQNHVSQQQQSVEVNQPPGTRQPPSGGNQPQQQMNHRQRVRDVGSMKQDYSDVESSREAELRHKRAKSKSTDDMTLGERGGGGGGGPGGGNISLDSNTLKRMLKPMPSMESPVTSPEMSRRRYGRHHHHHNHHHHHHPHADMGSSFLSEPETSSAPNNHHRPNSAAATSRFSNSRSAHEFGRGLYLELERDRGDVSPPSDNVLFDNQCYATTPSSSNGNNSDMEPSGQPHNTASTPGSPTSRLLLEYEMHLRNTLAKGMDAESYSLHTFEALLTQSMENLESIVWNENNRHPHQHHHHHLHPNNSVNSHHNINNNQAASHHSHHHPNQPRQQQRPQLQRANSAVAAANASWWTNQQPSTASSSASSAGPTKPPSGRERQLQASLNELHHKYRTLACCSAAAAAAAASGRGAPTHKSSQSTRSIPGEFAEQLPGGSNQRSPYPTRRRPGSSASLNKSSTLPLPHRGQPERPASARERTERLDRDRDGYYSDRNELVRERGDRGGYLSDHNSRSSVFERQDSLRSEYMSDRESSSRYGIVQQASVESADSRLCYLTSSEMSDDDRMSLTTAVSDDDDAESVHNSPYRAKQTGTAAASFNCTGAVRKAGFLSVKKWLLRKKHQIELARKRGWKGYWVCLKGTTLLFYPCDSREGRSVEAAPKHLIIVDGAIMQPIPEHPKRDYIFCLSTAFGDAYLFQAPCQVELENWVNSIHSACAAAFARHRGKTGTLHLLQEEIFRLDKAIESDHKLKHMADLQQSVVSDAETKRQITGQIVQWEENLERLHCEQFRLRCYMASLQNGELPNPKSLLTHVSRATKNTLNRLGVFTVSSFHAFICARSPSLLNNLLAGRGATKRRAPMLSRSNSGSSRRSLQLGSSSGSRDESSKAAKVLLPEGQSAHVILRDAMSVEEFLASACSRKNLNPMEHFVRVKKRRDMEDHNYFVPHRTDLIETYLHTHEVVEVCAKILYQVELQRATLEQMWGFSVEAELIENAERQDELCCYVSRVEDKSVAMQNGIIKGDEIMVINGAIVSDLDMMYLESVLQEELALCMMMRSSRTEPPDIANLMRGATDDIIDSLVCPPPPSDGLISEEVISGLIVPAPGWTKEVYSPETESSPAPSSDAGKASRANSFEIENLLKTAEQVTGFCRSPVETRKSSPTGSIVSSQSQQAAVLTPSRQLTDAEKLRKVILELVDTERTYVKHLNSLLENYLEPLKKETFLSNAEINALFGNIQEIVAFQRQFLQNLDEALDMEPEFHKFEHPGQFKNVLFSIGSAFLYYVNHFKLYSSFCASHSKAQKVLHPNEGNQALQEFLASRNPRQQHSSTLESYLIKPIQRILKYPLLLQQLRNLTSPQADEHQHLVEALKGMEKVAEHINEMQRIHEEYGAIFDHLFRQHQKSCKQPIDLSPGDLLYYGGVEWLNISDFLGKIKKGLELHAMCFVFKSAVVFLCKERLRQKKKLMGVASKAAASEVEIIRYQVLIPVTEVQVRASSAKDMDSHFLWELIHLRSQLQRRSEKVYVLSNSTADFRNAFLKTIRQIIRESVRNMSIPATKPTSGGTGSGGSSSGGGGSGDGNGGAIPGKPAPMPTSGPGAHNSHTLGKPKKLPKGPQRHSAGNIDYDNLDPKDEDGAVSGPEGGGRPFRARSKTVSDGVVPDDVLPLQTPPGVVQPKETSDPGSKSEGEEDSVATASSRKPTLGRTPNHLSLSTTSTLSAGSTGSQARLIQSSHQPQNYQPQPVKELGSPVWKPRDTVGEAATLPRKGKSSTTTVTSATINSAPGDSRSLKKFTDYGGSSLSFANPSASSSNASSSGGSGKRRDT